MHTVVLHQFMPKTDVFVVKELAVESKGHLIFPFFLTPVYIRQINKRWQTGGDSSWYQKKHKLKSIIT